MELSTLRSSHFFVFVSFSECAFQTWNVLATCFPKVCHGLANCRRCGHDSTILINILEEFQYGDKGLPALYISKLHKENDRTEMLMEICLSLGEEFLLMVLEAESWVILWQSS